MGGRVAQSIAGASPGSVEHLILESSSFGMKDETERKERYGKDLAMLERIKNSGDFRRFLEEWYSMPLFSTLGKEGLRDGMIDSKLHNDIDELKKAISLLSTGNHPCFLKEPGLAGLTVTFFCGREDKKYRETALHAKKHIPGMDIITFENASHNVHAQYPGLVAQAIRKIIDG